MSSRITDNDLEVQVAIINRLAGTPVTSGDNVHQVNPGNYYIATAYGGVKLVQISADGGGRNDISRHGYMKKESSSIF